MNGKRENPENNSRTRRTYSIGIKNEKVQEEEKTLFERITSFLGAMYYNISKIVIVSSLTIGIGVLVTNYNVFPVIERFFVKEYGTEKVKESLIKTKGLDLSKDVVGEEEFKTIYNKVMNEMAPNIIEEQLFNEGQASFNEKMKLFYSKSYEEKVITDDVLYNTLSNIYKFNYRRPDSVTLVSIGKVMRNENPITKAVLDINAVDDDLGFHVSSVALFFNSKQEIQDVKVIFEDKEYTNTRTPLKISTSSEDYWASSLIEDTTNSFMNKEVNSFFKEFTNKALYDKIQISTLDLGNSQLKSFFSKLDIKDKDYDVLSELFMLIKGNTNNLSIFEYMATDLDVEEPKTNVILLVKTTEKTYKYSLNFDRLSKEIISITRV